MRVKHMKKLTLFLTMTALLITPYHATVDGGCCSSGSRACKISRGPSPIQCMDMGGCGYDASSRSVSLVATVAFAAIMTGIIFAIGFSNSAHVSHSE